MTNAEQVRRDVANMIADDPITVTIAGKDYQAAFGGRGERKPLQIGGFMDEPELSIMLSIKDRDGSHLFNPLPAVGDVILIRDENFRVERFEIDASNEALQLDLTSPDK